MNDLKDEKKGDLHEQNKRERYICTCMFLYICIGTYKASPLVGAHMYSNVHMCANVCMEIDICMYI